MRQRRVLSFLAILWFAMPASAQAASQLTLATVLERGADLVGSSTRVLWRGDGHQLTMILDGADGEGLHVLVDGLPDLDPIATAAQALRAMKIPFEKPARFPEVSWLDAATLRLVHGNAVWHWPVGADEARRVLRWQPPSRDPASRDPRMAIAPGDGHAAVRRNHQLWLYDKDGEARQLTFDGSDDIVIGGAAHRAEFGITTGMFWSPDGRYLAFYREDQRPIAKYPYQNALAVPPSPRHGRYPMAGRVHSRVEVRVCDTVNYDVVTLENDPADDLYWTNVSFAPDGNVLVALVNRGQDTMELARFDEHSGKRVATLLREHDEQWIEPEHPATFLADGSFLWWSSVSGYRHLYQHDNDGKHLRQVTSGSFDVRSLLRVDEQRGLVFFQGSGDDPRQLHLFSASLRGGPQRQLTQLRGTHVAELSPDGTHANVLWSNLQTPPSRSIVHLDSGASTVLPRMPSALDDYALPQQHFFEQRAEDGSLLYGHLALPPDLDPNKQYPVIHYVYGGPHAQLVTDSWLGGASLWLQALACEGFIVSRIDNRGTPNRGIEFEQKIWRNLGTPEVQDQLKALDYLYKMPTVDRDRIGVHGWSYGGYMTLRLMLLRPDLFACGISGAPVTDWAMYETGYTERYMDTPQENPTGFQRASCLPLAGQLKAPLLLVHGTDDRTVMWSHTLQFVDRCIEAGVDLDYFPYPQQLHGLRGKDRAHFLRKLHAFFHRHLKPTKPD